MLFFTDWLFWICKIFFRQAVVFCEQWKWKEIAWKDYCYFSFNRFFPIHPAATWINAAFSALFLFSFCSGRMCILHAVECVLRYFSVQKGLERKTTARGECWVLYREETSLLMTLLGSPPANKYSQLDLGLGISKAKVVRHRISKRKLLIICVSCGLISSVTSTQEKESFMVCWHFSLPFLWSTAIQALFHGSGR